MEKMFQEDKGFRALCLLNDWWQHLPGRGGARAEDCEEKCRAIVYKVELQTNHQQSFQHHGDHIRDGRVWLHRFLKTPVPFTYSI